MAYSIAQLDKIIDIKVIIQFDIATVTSLAYSIIIDPIFNDAPGSKSDIDQIYIQGFDRVNIKLHNPGTAAHPVVGKMIYCGIINEWIKANDKKLSITNRDIMIIITKNISTQKTIGVIRQYARYLTNIITAYNICSHECKSVVPEKEIGGCMFGLNDEVALMGFTGSGIVETMCAMAYALTEFDDRKLFLDIGSAMVTCDGTILRAMTKNVKCNISEMKNHYRIYITKWCIANGGQKKVCEKLRASIKAIYGCKKMEDIVRLTSELAYSIDYYCNVITELEKKVDLY